MPSRYVNLVSNFKKSFPEAKKISVYRAPGRVNLIGEHTDYNGLPVLPMAIEQDIAICASPQNDRKVIIKNTEPSFEDREFEISFEIKPYEKGDWGNYSKAAFQTLQDYLAIQKKEKRLLSGMRALVNGSLPEGSGLSSSSALVVATAVTINDLNKLGLDKLFLAELLAVGEKYVGTEGGGMDQAISLCGKSGEVLKIDFFPLRIEYIRFPENYVIVVCNSLVDARKSAGANLTYNQRVIECRLGAAIIKTTLEKKYKKECPVKLLGDLRKTTFSYLLENVNDMLDEIFPKDNFRLSGISSILQMNEETTRQQYLKLKDGSYFEVPSSGFKIKNRLRHVFTEAERVEKSKELIKNQNMHEFGRLMYESHKSCAADYGISCPELNNLVEIAKNSGAAGARLTGAGFGGCTVNLVRKDKIDRFKKNLVREYYQNYLKKEGDFSDYIFVCQPSSGAGKINQDFIKN
jgi:N-acetylgalactosamine kinase